MITLDILRSEISIAARNVLRQRRRSALAASGIAFGIVALMLAGGFIDWLLWAMRESAIHSQIGHIQVVRRGYIEHGLADPFAHLLPPHSPELEHLARAPHVTAIAPRLSFSGLISRGESTVSFIGDGVQPDQETLLSRTLTIAKGKNLSVGDAKGAILGNGLAANLGAEVGDTVVLMAGTATRGVSAVECVVRGVFVTAAKAYDDVALRIPIETARELVRADGAHRWVVLLEKTEQTQDTIDYLSARYGKTEIEALPWTGLADFYNKTAALFSRQVAVMKLFVAMIILLSIANTRMMTVLERTGEVGTSMALGATRAGILRTFVLEGATLGILGGMAGAGLGWLLAALITSIGIPMPPAPGMEHGYTAGILVSGKLAVEVTVLAAGTALLASLYPAWTASQMNIVEALRFGS